MEEGGTRGGKAPEKKGVGAQATPGKMILEN